MQSGSDVLLVVFLLGGMVAGIGGLIWLFRYYDRKGGPAPSPENVPSAQSEEVEVGLRPGAALNAAVEIMLRRGYRLEERTENTASFARYQGTEVACLGCALMVLFIIPGLLYLIFAQKTERVSMVAHPIEGGARIVMGGHPEAIVRAAQWVRELPKPGEVPVPDPSTTQETPPTDTATIPEQIRRLAELRDAGLITSDEFEMKKAELLRRM